MSNVETIPNAKNSKPSRSVLNICDPEFGLCFGFRASNFEFRGPTGFTIIELLVVMAVIIILAGLILSTVGYVENKGARSRAEAEIAAMSATLESYKADNGTYPRDTTTDNVDAHAAIDFSKYQPASQHLYGQLAADPDFDGVPNTGSTSYMQFKPNQVGKDMNGKVYLRDPFGNSYGYSTAYQKDPATGYNPTFDLWSTAGLTSGASDTKWIKNW
jgi:prepilin-type N-terminal cleavage/methylation domain-containing protein